MDNAKAAEQKIKKAKQGKANEIPAQLEPALSESESEVIATRPWDQFTKKSR